jgi:hypothetical protein
VDAGRWRFRRWSGFSASVGVAAAVAAFLDYTNRQGDPPATATEAVDTNLNRLMVNEEIGLSHMLKSDERDELTEQWRRVRADMDRTDAPTHTRTASTARSSTPSTRATTSSKSPCQ